VKNELELRQLRVFLAVVEVAGYSRAATALGLSQSTVSEAIASLERTLGATLLRREGRRVVPTDPGEVLRGFAQKLVALAAEAAAKTSMAADTATPQLAIGAADSLGSYLLPDALARLRAARPQSRATIRTGDCEEIRAWVQDGEVEVGLVIEPVMARTKDRGEALIGHCPLILCGRPRAGNFGALELRRCAVHIAGLEGLYHKALRTCLRRAGAPMPPLHAGGSIEGVKRAVLSSPDAVGVLPSFAVAPELEQGELQVLKLDPPLPMLRVAAVWQGGKRTVPRPLVTELVTLLGAALSGASSSAPRRRERGSRVDAR